jgi:predicted NUDIX family NTP pyrophosphohydrolase
MGAAEPPGIDRIDPIKGVESGLCAKSNRRGRPGSCLSVRLLGEGAARLAPFVEGAAMAQRSAGLLVYRRTDEGAELFLVHPGGPFWAMKDEGAWSIPKGLCESGEDLLTAARREFKEETGFSVEGAFLWLGSFKQPSGKVIEAWAVEHDLDPDALHSNMFSMEWLPKSGRTAAFPEVDRAAWLPPDEALRKVTKGQRPIIEELMRKISQPRART